MEFSLHRQLKEHYAGRDGKFEVAQGGFRIDVVRRGQLIEIQHGSLAAIRRKVAALLADGYRLQIVKPIVAGKMIVKQKSVGGNVLHRRRSPKQGQMLDLFHELVYFTSVFPHPRLSLLVPLVEIEEWRYPGHGRRRRKRAGDFRVEDQRLVRIHSQQRFCRAADLLSLLPADLPQPFHTAQLAERLCVDRWVAQRIAYCLRQIRALQSVGKQGNALLYAFPQRPAA
jgi:hypothetical protein